MFKNLKINLGENFQRSYWWELFKNRINKNPVLNIVDIKTKERWKILKEYFEKNNIE